MSWAYKVRGFLRDSVLSLLFFSNRLFGKEGHPDREVWLLSHPGSIKTLHSGENGDEYLKPIKSILGEESYAEFCVPNYRSPFFTVATDRYACLEAQGKLHHLLKAKSVWNHTAIEAYQKKFPQSSKFQLCLHYAFYQDILSRYEPAVLVFTVSYSKLYALVLAAKDLGITTVELQHGRVVEDHPAYMQSVEEYVTPSYFIVQSEREKQILTEGGVFEEDQICPLGIPRYDFLEDYSVRESFLDEVGLSSDKKTLFWPTQTHDERMTKSGENDANTRVVFEAVKELDDWQILLKPHPHETFQKSKAYYEGWADDIGLDSFVFLAADYCPTYDCLSVADATVIKHSTVGIESLLCRTPVINLEVRESYELLPYKELRCFRKVTDTESMVDLLREEIFSEDYQRCFKKTRDEYVNRHFENFGQASEAVAEFIRREGGLIE